MTKKLQTCPLKTAERNLTTVVLPENFGPITMNLHGISGLGGHKYGLGFSMKMFILSFVDKKYSLSKKLQMIILFHI